MNAFVLMVPLFLIRFGVLGLADKGALRRAAHFAPAQGGERIALPLYQVSNAFLVLHPLVLRVGTEAPLFWAAAAVYAIGVAVLLAAAVCFAKPGRSGLNTDGIYRFSRNPMYVGYFLYFLGCVLLMRSLPLLVALLVFQGCAHWIIRSEERWCIERFGDAYQRYLRQVRRYL